MADASDPPGHTIEQRLIGMLMAQPAYAEEYPHLDQLMAGEDHRRLFRIVRDLRSADLMTLAEHMPLDLLEYARDLALYQSFNPERFPAYVLVLHGIEQVRAYAAAVRRLRPSHNGSNPFKAI